MHGAVADEPIEVHVRQTIESYVTDRRACHTLPAFCEVAKFVCLFDDFLSHYLVDAFCFTHKLSSPTKQADRPC